MAVKQQAVTVDRQKLLPNTITHNTWVLHSKKAWYKVCRDLYMLLLDRVLKGIELAQHPEHLIGIATSLKRLMPA